MSGLADPAGDSDVFHTCGLFSMYAFLSLSIRDVSMWEPKVVSGGSSTSSAGKTYQRKQDSVMYADVIPNSGKRTAHNCLHCSSSIASVSSELDCSVESVELDDDPGGIGSRRARRLMEACGARSSGTCRRRALLRQLQRACQLLLKVVEHVSQQIWNKTVYIRVSCASLSSIVSGTGPFRLLAFSRTLFALATRTAELIGSAIVENSSSRSWLIMQ